AGRLVDDEDVPVLMEHPELPGDLPRLGAIREEGEIGVGLDLAPGLVAEDTRQLDPAVAHGLLRRASREGKALGDQLVDPDGHGGEGRSRRVEAKGREPGRNWAALQS